MKIELKMRVYDDPHYWGILSSSNAWCLYFSCDSLKEYLDEIEPNFRKRFIERMVKRYEN